MNATAQGQMAGSAEFRRLVPKIPQCHGSAQNNSDGAIPPNNIAAWLSICLSGIGGT